MASDASNTTPPLVDLNATAAETPPVPLFVVAAQQNNASDDSIITTFGDDETEIAITIPPVAPLTPTRYPGINQSES